MPRLSILIPLLDDTSRFEDSLASVLQNRPSKCEVVVVDSTRYEDPYDLRGEVRFVAVEPGTGLIDAINAGFRAAKGRVVNLLQPGVVVRDGWTRPALSWFDEQQMAAVAPVVFDASDESRVVSAGVAYSRTGRRIVHLAAASADRLARSPKAPLAPTLSFGFYRRSVVNAVGGFCRSAGATHADVDMGLTSQALGLRCGLEPESAAVMNPEALAVSPTYVSGRSEEIVFWRHRSSTGRFMSRGGHSLSVAGGFLRHVGSVGAFTSLLGHLAGWRRREAAEVQAERIRRAAETLERNRSRSNSPHSSGKPGAQEPIRQLLGGLQTRRAA